MIMMPEDILDAAAAHMKDRQSTYDSPGGERSMEKTVNMFNAMLGGDRALTTEQGWMFMAILKIVRSQQGDYRADNYEDLAAYAALAAEQAHKDNVSKDKPLPSSVPVDSDEWDWVRVKRGT